MEFEIGCKVIALQEPALLIVRICDCDTTGVSSPWLSSWTYKSLKVQISQIMSQVACLLFVYIH
jgi:hypothetical protein